MSLEEKRPVSDRPFLAFPPQGEGGLIETL